MLHTVTIDRRQSKRYLVVGKAVLRMSRGIATGELVDVGRGGLQVLMDAPPPVGESLWVQFAVQGYPLEVKSIGQVVRSEAGFVGIAFPEDHPDLEEVLLWLEAGFLAALF